MAEYGVYAVAMAAFNTIAYIVAFGLEDASTTYIPRIFAEYGKVAAADSFAAYSFTVSRFSGCELRHYALRHASPGSTDHDHSAEWCSRRSGGSP